MEGQEIFLLLQPTLSFISFFRPGASFAFRLTQETKLVVLSYISTMHFAKALILPIVLALTVVAAPVPAPEGNLVTLEARHCHPDPNHPCHQHLRAAAAAYFAPVNTNQAPVDAPVGDQSSSSGASTTG
ncbi:hypothetical protein FRC18_000644 [Serendipita sp. 400]|nr:hypothetical protein FRC18_000644 [Serendipita sp. 400]